MKCFVIVREETPGQFTAWPAGIPELKVFAGDREKARSLLRSHLVAWIRDGTLGTVELPEWEPDTKSEEALTEEQQHEAFMKILRRNRREDDEREGIWDVDPNDPEAVKMLKEERRYRREELKGTIWDYELPSRSISLTPNA